MADHWQPKSEHQIKPAQTMLKVPVSVSTVLSSWSHYCGFLFCIIGRMSRSMIWTHNQVGSAESANQIPLFGTNGQIAQDTMAGTDLDRGPFALNAPRKLPVYERKELDRLIEKPLCQYIHQEVMPKTHLDHMWLEATCSLCFVPPQLTNRQRCSQRIRYPT